MFHVSPKTTIVSQKQQNKLMKQVLFLSVNCFLWTNKDDPLGNLLAILKLYDYI